MARGAWKYVGSRFGNKPLPAEKVAITVACEELIAEVLQPQFLPEIRPSATFSYPAAIKGKRHGSKHRFLTRYRSGDPAFLAAEFEAPFARLDYVGRDRYDFLWHRHTGEWHRVAEHLSLTAALHRIASEPYFRCC